MRFFSEDDEHVNGECEHCGRILKIKKWELEPSDFGFRLETAARCPCGSLHNSISGHTSTSGSISDKIRCPKCGSDQIHASNKGFGVGKAIVGGVLLGPVGLLGGMLGSKKVLMTCLKCGKTFKPGG